MLICFSDHVTRNHLQHFSFSTQAICDIYSTNTKGSCSDNFKTKAKTNKQTKRKQNK